MPPDEEKIKIIELNDLHKIMNEYLILNPDTDITPWFSRLSDEFGVKPHHLDQHTFLMLMCGEKYIHEFYFEIVGDFFSWLINL